MKPWLVAFVLSAGIMLGWSFPLPVGALAGLVCLVRPRTRWAAVVIWLAILRVQPAVQAQPQLPRFEGQSVEVSGTVAAQQPDSTGAWTTLAVRRLQELQLPAGVVTAGMRLFESLEQGTRVTVECRELRLQQRDGLFVSKPTIRCGSSRLVETRRAPLPIPQLNRARTAYADALNQTLPEPAASLAIGLTLGETDGLPASVQENFRRTGTSHVLALSGYNVSLFVTLLWASLPSRIGRRRTYGVILIVLAGFLLMTGIPPSLLRATAMAVLLIAAHALGRRATPGRVLSLSVCGLLFAQPTLLNDIGFVLSVLATAGLVAGADRLFRRLRRPRLLREGLAATVSAFLITLPVILVAFGRLPLVSPVSNLLILPLVPVLFFGSLLSGLLGLILPQAAVSLNGLFVWLANLFVAIVDWTAGWPFASVQVRLPNLLAPMLLLSTAAVLARSPRACNRCACPTVTPAYV